MITRSLACLFVASILSISSAQAVILAYWDMNSLGNNLPAGTTIGATDGAGTLRLTNDPANSGAQWNVKDDSGTTINLQFDSVAGNSFEVRGGQAANGAFFDYLVDTTGYQDIEFSFAMQVSDNGYDQNSLQYSIDGGSNFLSFDITATNATGNVNTTANTFGLDDSGFSLYTFDFSDISGANDNSGLIIRPVFGGSGTAQASRGSNWDNVVFEGSAIPEPSTVAMLMGGLGATILLIRRTKS